MTYSRPAGECTPFAVRKGLASCSVSRTVTSSGLASSSNSGVMNTAGYSHSTIKTMVDTARGEWAKRFCLPDLLRVVRAEGVQTVESGPRKMITPGGLLKMRDNPMHLVTLMNAAPRCKARSKRSQQACRAPAIRGRDTCRMHGGRSPGAPKGERNGNFKLGLHTNEIMALKRELSAIWRNARQLLKNMG